MPIFDQGYQHWSGQPTGNAWRWLVITRHGVRTQLKNRVVRLLLLVSWIPALLLVGALAIWGLIEQKSETVSSLFGQVFPLGAGMLSDPRAYRWAVWTIAYSHFFWIEMFFIMFLILAVGPGLVSRDLRFNALPLYFSRPLRRFDYFLGKLGVIGVLVAAVAVAPAVVAYVLGVCFSLDVTVVRDTYWVLFASAAYGLVIAISAGTLMLALSSLSRRSIYVGIAWFGFWTISGSVALVLTGIQQVSMVRDASQETWPEGVGQMNRESRRMQQQQQRKIQEFGERVERAQAAAAPTNWRPLFSYTANLTRIGELLLRSDAAWVEIGRAVETQKRAITGGLGGFAALFAPPPDPINERSLADVWTPQYPWTWSAMVLAGLFVLSLWILTSRVKSLDRLK